MLKTLIGIFSDSHNNINNLKNAASKAVEFGAKKLIHLGDNYADASTLYEFSKDVVNIPGIFCKEYKDITIPNRIILEIEGFKILLSHTPTSNPADLPEDLKPEQLIAENKIDIFLYGHTHLYEVMIKGDILHLNPGHLKTDDKKSPILTFGTLELEKTKAIGKVFDISGKLLSESALYKF
jgi:putative phosphoesterase